MKICDRTRYCIYFAVNDTGNCLFMTEYKGFDKNPEDIIHFPEIVNDKNRLETELIWNKTPVPKDIGCYQAVVTLIQGTGKDYTLHVLSCTPVCFL